MIMTLLLNGLSYGLVLFLLSLGLALSLTIAKFVNLAQGLFAMQGGYLGYVLMTRCGLSFYACLPVCFGAGALTGLLLEALLLRHFYARSPLEHAGVSLGLIFMAAGYAEHVMGPSPLFIALPKLLQTPLTLFGATISLYRLALMACCTVLAALLQSAMHHTPLGAQFRAASENPALARALGINVPFLFSASFAFCCGLAGLGGLCTMDFLGMDPLFALRFMGIALVIASLGGVRGLTGTLCAALFVGVCSSVGAYVLPSSGTLVLDVCALVLLLSVSPEIFARGSRFS